mmetsp:Transcript_28691/g.57234  ORF Transcript_28691/g.57234 Transcript_28691/m.57234 type:complete len:321 (+) Transcript_28691:592-1554(+)
MQRSPIHPRQQRNLQRQMHIKRIQPIILPHKPFEPRGQSPILPRRRKQTLLPIALRRNPRLRRTKHVFVIAIRMQMLVKKGEGVGSIRIVPVGVFSKGVLGRLPRSRADEGLVVLGEEAREGVADECEDVDSLHGSSRGECRVDERFVHLLGVEFVLEHESGGAAPAFGEHDVGEFVGVGVGDADAFAGAAFFEVASVDGGVGVAVAEGLFVGEVEGAGGELEGGLGGGGVVAVAFEGVVGGVVVFVGGFAEEHPGDEVGYGGGIVVVGLLCLRGGSVVDVVGGHIVLVRQSYLGFIATLLVGCGCVECEERRSSENKGH